MPKVYNVQNNFTRGEISPRLTGRVDLDQYKNGCAIVKNFLPLPHGGIQNRGGTMYVNSGKTAGKKIRLIPFEYPDQAYMLEFGEGYIRVYKDQTHVYNSSTITGATAANPVVITSAAHGFSNGDIVHIYGVVGMTELNGNQYTVANKAAGTFELSGVDGTGYTAYTSGGTAAGPELVTTYTEAELNDIQFVQSFDSLYLVHPSHPPAKISRTSSTAWVIADISFTATPTEWTGTNYPSCVEIFEQRMVFAATPAEQDTLWFSKAGDYADMTVGTSADDALVYVIDASIKWLSASRVLAAGASDGIFVVSASSSLEAITPTNIRVVRETSFSTSEEMPAKIENVLLFVQKSRRKILELSYAFESDSWTAPDLTLLSEHITKTGVSGVAYQQEPDSILWAFRDDGKLIGMTYKRDQNVVAWHEHEIGGTSDVSGTKAVVESIAVIPSQNGERDELWLSVKRYINSTTVRTIEVLTAGLDENEDIRDSFYLDCGLSTSQQTITGITKANPAVVTSVAHGYSDGDTIYIRSLVGMSEVNEGSYTVANKTADTFQLSGVNSTSYGAYVSGGIAEKYVTTITGLDYLEGEEVAILADGAVRNNATVSSGSITISPSGHRVHAGLSYNCDIQTLAIEAGSVDGPALGKVKRINEVGLKLHNTVGVLVGKDADNLDRIPFRSSANPMDVAVPLFTGNKFLPFNGGYDETTSIYIRQNQPLPITILAIMARVKTNN